MERHIIQPRSTATKKRSDLLLVGNSDVTVALLQLSSTIHEEAARILYGLNTFSFGGENCWIDPIYFKWRLTDISRRNVRTLVIKIPEIDRGRDGELNGATLNGHKSLKNFPGL
ncbi:hypothetical protein XANCAGTX0491_001431 [Xanthoria calcicola]